MRLGFIGGWGHNYLGAYVGKDGPATEVAFATDGYDNERAKMRAENFTTRGADVKWFDDAIEMLDTFKPDITVVGAVYGQNGTFVYESTQRGIPVVSDKPIAGSWESYEQIVKAYEKTGTAVITEFPFRSHPAFRAAQAAVADGKIGEVVLANGQKSYRFGDKRPAWYGDRDQYGGTILWVAGHAIDFVRFATGLKFTRVYGQQSNISKPSYGSMEEVTVNVFELENGAHAIVHADYNRPAKAATHGDDRLRIAGSVGLLEVRDEVCMLCTNDQEEQDITGSAETGEIADEMLAALKGEQADIYSTESSFEMARVMLHARDAADKRTVVDIT